MNRRAILALPLAILIAASRLVRLNALIVATLIGLAPLTVAAGESPSTTAASASHLAEGEVRKVDKETGKITLRHGPIASLDMPAMSMVFQVKDPDMLNQVKAGDKVRFQAEKIGSQYTVTHIEPAK